MADIDTGVGSPPAGRPLTQGNVVTTNPPDAGLGAGGTVVRMDAFDETGRQVTVNATGATFTTATGGPA